MFKIIEKKQLNDVTFSMTIHAPLVAQNIQPGQFVMVMTDEDSERIPLTISDFDKEKGSVTIVFQAIGASTIKLSHKNEGEEIAHFAGPLGAATELEGIKNACVIGGLFSAVTEVTSLEAPCKVVPVAVMDTFGKSGPAAELLEVFNLNKETIVEKVLENI